MRFKLLLLSLLVAFGVSAQTNVRELGITGPVQDTTISRGVKGWIRHDPVTGKYRFWNSSTLTWQSFSTGAVDSYTKTQADQRFASESTGLLSGGALSINGGDNTKFDIALGVGIFVDITSSVQTPTVSQLSWTAKTAITVTDIATQPVTYVGINSSDVVIQQPTPFTETQRRSIIQLGLVVHSNNVIVNAVNNFPSVLNNPTSQLHDLMNAVGFLNTSGNVYSANGANLNVDKSAGTIFKLGANQQTSNLAPNTVSLSAGTAITFRYRRQNSAEGSDVTAIDPDNYDVGGTLTAVPNNRWTIQRINVFQSNLTRIQYGQAVYTTLADAIAAVGTETFVTETNIRDNGILRAYLIVKKGTTALNSADNRFLDVTKFGSSVGGGGSGATTLQVAYDNSVIPQILTDATRGALTIRRGSAADTDDVLAIQNNAGTQTFGVKGTGAINSVVNVPSANSHTGTWTATANNDYHENRAAIATLRNTTSDNIFGTKISHTFISGAANQNAIALEVVPTFTPTGGAFNSQVSARIIGRTHLMATPTVTTNAAILSILGAGTTTANIVFFANSGGTERFSVRDNGQAFVTSSNPNSFNLTSTFTATSTGQMASQIVGTLTGRAGTANDLYYQYLNAQNFTSGNTGHNISAFATIGNTYTFNHANGVLRGLYHNPTIAGSQTASLTHLAIHTVSGDHLFGGTTITTGSILADFQSTTKGLMLPRVTNMAAVTTPVSGLLAYDAAIGKFVAYEAGSWRHLVGNGGTRDFDASTWNFAANALTISKSQQTTVVGTSGIDITQAGAGTSAVYTANADIAQMRVADAGGNVKGRMILNGTSYFGVESTDNTYPVQIAIPAVSATVGTFSALRIRDTGVAFNPSSGTAVFNGLLIDSEYNVTGGTTVVNGVNYDPDVTSLNGATHYAFRHDQGFVAWQSKLSPAQITADQTDYNPTGFNNGGTPNGASILRVTTDASRNLFSLVNAADGRMLLIMNVGSQNLVVKDDDGSTGTAAYRFALTADLTVLPDETRMFIYDGTSSRWRLMY